jgi:hypothetical protein
MGIKKKQYEIIEIDIKQLIKKGKKNEKTTTDK